MTVRTRYDLPAPASSQDVIALGAPNRNLVSIPNAPPDHVKGKVDEVALSAIARNSSQ